MVIKNLILLLLLLASILEAEKSLEIEFNQEEKDWMLSHQVINFTGDPNWLPFEAFSESGVYIGILADILDIVESKTTLKFNKMATKNWDRSVSLLKNGQVDMLSETTDSNLAKEFLFTDSFLLNPIVVIMRDGSSYVDNLSKLKDKKIVLIKDYGYTQKIKKKYLKHKFYEVQNIQEGLQSVSEGKYDAVLATMALGSYQIRNMQLSNVKVVGRTEFSTQIGFAIKHEYKPLIGILNKVLKSIDEQTKQKILSKWISQEYVEKTDYTLLLQIAFVSFLIISGTLFWSMQLKREIARRVILEKQNKKMLAQQAKYAALGEMMDAVAHQWKQPLNAIVMLNELLVLEQKDRSLDEAYLKDYQKDMDIQVEHLLNTLSEFRTFFRPDKEMETFNLLKSIDAVLLLVKDEFLKNSIEVIVDCNENVNLKLIKNEFKHIILNILNNAKDAFVQNEIKIKKINIKVSENKEELIIEINDNAGGIPEYILPKIFEANITSKSEGKGTGIGLYMSKQIADKMSAKLSAQNIENGASFKLLFKLSKDLL